MKITTTVDIPDRRIADLLCTAFEGGVGYWCVIIGYEEPKEIRSILEESRVVKYTDYPLTGGSVRCTTTDDDTKILLLDGYAIRRGLVRMAKKYQTHFVNFLSENEDAETGDVFLQCCFFEELVYG